MNTQLTDRNGYIIEQVIPVSDGLEDLSPSERVKKRLERRNGILKAAIVGISVCVLFAIIKFFIGTSSHSLAIRSDAISSLTESYSYIISFLGISLAHKKPDSKHPNGYGRIEYLTAIVGGVLVLITGWHFFETSLRRIYKPEMSSVTGLQLVIIALTILGKLYLYFDDKKIGHKFNSAGLITASRSALLSSLSSLLVIIAAVVAQVYKVDIDGWVGLIIACFMIFVGIVGLKGGITSILGKPVSKKVAQAITRILLDNPPIVGVYDLRINNLGTGLFRGTVNAEVPAETNAEEVYEAFRKARTEIYRKTGVDMTIGIITVNYCKEEVFPKYQRISNKILNEEGVQNVHGFNWNEDTNDVDLHVIVDYNSLNNQDLEEKIRDIVKEEIPDSNVLVDFNVNCIEDPNQLKEAVCKIQ